MLGYGEGKDCTGDTSSSRACGVSSKRNPPACVFLGRAWVLVAARLGSADPDLVHSGLSLSALKLVLLFRVSAPISLVSWGRALNGVQKTLYKVIIVLK